MNNIISSTVNIYLQTFNGYFAQFLSWGKEFFLVGLVITIVWMCLWHAFDKNSFHESMPGFIKEFFIIALFYTIMISAKDWLGTIPSSATYMGKILSGIKVDPSSIIDQGIRVTNQLAVKINPSGVMEKLYAAIIVAVANVIILFAFISVALELAVTTLTIYFFIAMSGFALAFSVFSFTRSIARKTLDIVIASSMKLLSLYVIVAAGSGVFAAISQELAPGANPFDVLGWIVAAALLFWLVSKNIPMQVARVFSEAIHETRGTDAAALAMSAVSYARTATPALSLAAGKAAGSALGAAKTFGSTLSNAKAHFQDARSQGSGLGSSFGSAATGTAKHALSSVGSGLSDHFKHLSSKLSGGNGVARSHGDIQGYAERMHGHTSNIKSGLASAGAPSSAGRKAAGPATTRSMRQGKPASKSK